MGVVCPSILQDQLIKGLDDFMGEGWSWKVTTPAAAISIVLVEIRFQWLQNKIPHEAHDLKAYGMPQPPKANRRKSLEKVFNIQSKNTVKKEKKNKKLMTA